MDMLIRGGTIVNATDEFEADLLIKDGKVALIGRNISGFTGTIVDAAGKYVLPGGVDNHTHFALPFGGTTSRGFETSPAAAVGGTTTVVDFAPQPAGVGLRDSVLAHIRDHAEGKSAVDFSMHGVVMDLSDALFDEIAELPTIGVSTVKLFMAYKGTPYMMDDGTLLRSLEAAKRSGVTVMVHAENGDLIDVLQKECLRVGHTAPKYHAVSRPPIVETEATNRAIAIAALADAPLFVVHVSAKEAMEAIRTAFASGQPIYGETCPHYLTLDVENLARGDFEGAKFVCSPALRTVEHRDALWMAVNRRWLQVVGSDHCGFDWGKQKRLGLNDFTKIPNGAPSVENRLAVLWTYGVAAGRISRQRLVDLYSTAPARLNGLYPRKGSLCVGADGDVVIFDPQYEGSMTAKGSLQGVDYSPYEGMRQVGCVERVYLRGELIVESGHFVGSPTGGVFVPGQPYGAAYSGF